jgi:macrolide transport system ATP-binding/permease protein
VIELSAVSRSYVMGGGVVHALHGIDLTIRAGEFVAIVGPSGSGKTTLMYLLGCLDRPTTGSYRLLGHEVAQLSDARLSQLRNRAIGYVFQQYHLLPNLTVVDNIGLGLVYAGVPREERHAIGAALAARMGLGQRTAHTARELSGGQMQRVAIARGLACRPGIILADEPTGNLDTKTGAEIMVLLRRLNAEGHTIVLVTHDPGIAAQARRVVRIVDGAIVSDSPGTAWQQAAPEGAAAHGAGGVEEAGGSAPPAPGDAAPDPAAAGTPLDAAIPAPPANGTLRQGDLVRMALHEGLLAHRLRTMLTMLGIVFGIAAVIAMTAITEGGKQSQLQQIRQIGMNNIQVRALDLAGARLVRLRRANPDGLTAADLDALRQYVPGIAASTAWKGVKAELRLGEHAVDDANVLGVTGDFQAVANFHVGDGRFLDDRDEQRAARVCVLGRAVAAGLGLEPATAAGASVLIGDEPFTVVGVMGGKTFTSSEIADAAVPDRNHDVYIPYATERAFFPKDERDSRLDAISLRMAGDEALLAQSKLIRRIVLDRHQGAEDTAVAVPLEGLRQAQRTKEIFNVIIVVIAAISLIVGGIGIMNIMLAAVTQRTREIGIRRAVGASRRDILAQFLAEALLISLFGAGLGLALGLGAGWTIGALSGFAVAFSGVIMAVAALTALAIGVAFGIYPAWLAAAMDPVEALRA